MKVLLCTPYNAGSEYEQGGIVVWANNIMNYYHTLDSEVQLDIVPFNRKVRDRGGIFTRVIGGITDYRFAIKEMNKQMKEGYDVLHLCTSAQLSLTKDFAVLRKAKRKGVKTVLHLHFGRIPDLVQKQNWEWLLLKRVMKLANAVVTMDVKSYETLRSVGYRNIHYLPNPLSQAIMLQIEDEFSSVMRIERKLCFVGHVIPTKGVFELVEACKQIDGIKLYVIGKVTKDVRSRMKKIAGGDWLVFEGEVSHQQVIKELLSSSIFVLPSYTEGFPNVILESMACGCAIVATPVGAIPEMLDIKGTNPCGVCISIKDVDSLRDALVDLLKNTTKARNNSNNARKRVYEQYAIPVVWEQLVNIWKNCFK